MRESSTWLQIGRHRLIWAAAIAAWMSRLGAGAEFEADLSWVPLFDGARSELLNTWGGAWGMGNVQAISLQTHTVHCRKRALSIEPGPTKAGQGRFFQCLASGGGPSPQYQQARDLSRYEQMDFHIYNATRAALRCTVELKDHRDSASHRAVFPFDLPAGEAWTAVSVPLTLGVGGWILEGEPDLSRIVSIAFCLTPETDMADDSRVFLDNLMLRERGGVLDIEHAPLEALAARLARRQWDGLWAARSRTHGLIPNNSYQVTDAALNCTAAVLWMLPAAARRAWVAPADADAYVELLLGTINRLLDRSAHVPPRHVDWVTLKPSLLPEESSIDAAFLALALHQYKSLPTTSPALRKAIDETENRFDFAAFACKTGWRMAYRYASPSCADGFVPCWYDGYTNEGNLISLAAHLNDRRRVPIDTHWNTTSLRQRAGLADIDGVPVVHLSCDFRAPFSQALWNLFADVRDRGIDCYPDGRLAVNPWHNFVCYQRHVMSRLAANGRRYLLQLDAGDDGSLGCYRQFSVYEDFGQHDLFMPWSATLALFSGEDGAKDALRYLLRHRLHDPYGLADSAKWTTGADEPYAVTARHDFWNTGLSTAALLDWLDGPSRQSKSFAELPEVRAALDCVFCPGK